jgi:hypothetical protein
VFQETQTKLKLTWWPTPQDYNEAIQITGANLQDPQLQQALVYTDAIGLPRPITGSFASVYRLHCPNNDFALRLFLRNISDQEERYSLISDFVQHDDLPYTVTFDFLKHGIKVMGEWLPALKMEWVDGPSLDDHIVENLANPDKLARLGDSFVKMMDDLHRAGIAHGDLQHGNIIVWRNELRLVDYDGMFVPAMQGFEANELGHRNYQHPARAARHFGPYLDNFSAWVIYASIKALQIDSRLLHQLGGGDDCLLFRQTDFLNPLQSHAFAAFEQHPNVELNALGRFLRLQLKYDPALVPPLHLPTPLVQKAQLEPLAPGVQIMRSGPRLVRGTLPDWLEQDNASALSLEDGATANTFGKQPWTVRTAPAAPWIKPVAPVTVPPELLVKQMRRVKYNRACGRRSPQVWQQLMLLNPLTWFMLFFCYLSFGPDKDLITRGEDLPATIVSVNSQATDSRRSNVSYRYEVKGRSYTRQNSVDNAAKYYMVGKKVVVRVLASDPTFAEDLGDEVGDRQSRDLIALYFCLALNLALESLIWLPALKHKELAQFGSPALARILDCVKSGGDKGEESYCVCLCFYHNKKEFETNLAVSASEFATITKGGVEVILYNRRLPYAPVLYRFCRYHAIVPGSP